MTIENELKNLILSKYKSIREFILEIDMPYTTIDSMFRRGIGNSSVANVIKICKALGISADELADGKITPVITRAVRPRNDFIEINDVLADAKIKLISHEDFTLDGEPIDDETAKAIVQGIDVSLELAKRRNKIHNKNHNKIEVE